MNTLSLTTTDLFPSNPVSPVNPVNPVRPPPLRATALPLPARDERAEGRAEGSATPRPTPTPAPVLIFKNIHRTVTDDALCLLTFDRPDSAANLFDSTTLDELDAHLAYIAAHPEIKALVLLSAKPAIFIAGADVHALYDTLHAPTADTRAQLTAMVERGQQLFDRLATLPIPTIAAIHGACLGGGFEVCLACDFRIASPDSATKIGLPETQLGILPAWGGSTRLPRLIGLPTALDLILNGKTLPAKLALKKGLIDELAPRENLLAAARRKLASLHGHLPHRPRPTSLLHRASALAAPLIAARVRNQVLRKTRGHYHAVISALDVITTGIRHSHAHSLRLERDAFADLATGSRARNLLNLFLLQEHAKKLTYPVPAGATIAPSDGRTKRLPLAPSPPVAEGEGRLSPPSPPVAEGEGRGEISPNNISHSEPLTHPAPGASSIARHEGEGVPTGRAMLGAPVLGEEGRPREALATAPPRVHSVAVIGAGVMGAGIAHWLSSHGVRVILKDINAAAVARGMTAIQKLYDDAVKRRLVTPLEARTGLDRIQPTVADVPLRHVDLVIEAAVERLDLKQELFRKLATQVGSNTLLLTNTSALSVTQLGGGTGVSNSVAGLHFFNPVHRMQLVEVVVGDATAPATVQRAVRFAQQIGKLPVVVRDRPGFLVNRILMPYLLEAGHLFTSGASIEDIDEAMLDFGMPMGPLRLIDEVGMDVSLHVAGTLATAFAPRLTVPAVLQQMIDAGWFGKKSGRGFYDHKGASAVPNALAARFATDTRSADLDHHELQSRLVLAMVNEAARCLEEGVVDSPADIDFAMVMGTGFAPFHGGPLRYADATGLREIVITLDTLSRSAGVSPASPPVPRSAGVSPASPSTAETRFTPCALLRDLAAANGTFYPAPGTAGVLACEFRRRLAARSELRDDPATPAPRVPFPNS